MCSWLRSSLTWISCKMVQEQAKAIETLRNCPNIENMLLDLEGHTLRNLPDAATIG